MGKRTRFSEFNAQHRGGKGVLCYKLSEKTGNLAAAVAVDDGDQIMLITNAGIVMRMPIHGVSIIGRNTSGVRLMNISKDENIKVSGIARVLADWVEEETEDSELEVANEGINVEETGSESTTEE